MAEKKPEQSGGKEEVAGVDPKVVAHVVETAEKEGLPPSVAEEIVQEGVEEGVAPDKLEEVADEAVRVERQDRLGEE